MNGYRQGAARLFCVTGILCATPFAAWAQQPVQANSAGPRTMTAARLATEERIVLDGRLDEPAWSRAVPAGDFVQVDPRNGQPATEPTEVRIVFDADALYMGVLCVDSEPDKWIAYQRRRDEFLGSDDKFRWTIDTFLDGRSGYFFETNPLGTMADALLGVNGQNRAWDGIWNVRVQRHDKGWTLEIEIPFRTLNFDPNSDTWGINFDRTVIRKNETTIWSGWARNQGIQRMTNAGRVTGIRDVTQGHGLDIKPYGLVESQSSPGRGRPADSKANAGVDLFYNLTPSIRTNLTVNTDFAQTEVDQRQVNLTRFSLFFPERRDFFLDGATFFDFSSSGGNNNEQVIPFFSRRVGLSAQGTPQKIDFGTKVTGVMGSHDIGVLHVRTGDDDDAGMIGEDFTVARMRRRMLAQSYVGAIYTRRDPGGAVGASHTAGLDGTLATSRFLGNQNLSASGYFLHAARPGVTSANNAMGFYINYPNDRWNGAIGGRQIERNFDPAVGFVNRRDYRRFNPRFTFNPRPSNHRYIRRFEFGVADSLFLTDLDNTLLERSVELQVFQVQFHTNDNFGFTVTPSYERLDAPFAISRGITLPAGREYRYTRWAFGGQTANRRKVSFGARIDRGSFYSGDRNQAVFSVGVRPGPGLIFSFNGEWNDVKLAEGHFTSNVYRVSTETQLSPFLYVLNNVQFDTVSRVAGWQARFRWILQPGNDLYVVYTHNWLEDPLADRFSTLDKRLASKILYTYRF